MEPRLTTLGIPNSSTVGELSHVSLVERVLQGDFFAWQDLVAQVHQIATKSAAYRGSDFAGNVALRTIERLEADKHRSLKGFMEALQTYPSLSFGRWLRTIIRNATVDELRGQPEFSRQRSEGKRVLAPRTHVLLDEQHGSIEFATLRFEERAFTTKAGRHLPIAKRRWSETQDPDIRCPDKINPHRGLSYGVSCF